jgi:hypothetical protein
LIKNIQVPDHGEVVSSRHRRPMPLPLAARNQTSFLRSRQQPISNENDAQHYPTQQPGFSYENHFGNFPNFSVNGSQQTTLVNNYVYPAENAAFNSSFNGSIVEVDDPPKNFASNDVNDGDDDLDEKPTDYSLRFQESEEPEYMAAPSSQQQQKPTLTQPIVDNSVVDIDDDDDDLCVDAVKSYFIEATPFDTPGPISEATSINDLRAIPDEAPIHHQDEDDEVQIGLHKISFPLYFFLLFWP